MFNFEKLEVWWKAIDFVRFELTNQLRRAAVSISSNLAEGSSNTGLSTLNSQP